MKNSTLLMIFAGIILIIFLMRKPINKVLTRGYRNNNPFNIRKTFDSAGNQTFWPHEIKGSDTDFKTFDTMVNGYLEGFRLLREYKAGGFDTITKIINRFAPSNENDTYAYIQAVTKDTGIDENTPVNFNDPMQFKNLVAAISYHENGITPDLNDIDEAYTLLS
jgi:hypothetical protein